jgi:hypothetical protein
MIAIGIDNGTTGSVGVIGAPGGPDFFPVPTKEFLHYTKSGKMVKRICTGTIETDFDDIDVNNCFAYIERPFTGSPMMIQSSLMAARAHEAVMIALERLGIGYVTIDSKEWQAALLPGVKGSPNLKKASKLKGIQLYPHLATYINQHGDADGLLIAHHYANL